MTFFDPNNIPPPQALKNFSPSQVKTFSLCERKWVLESLSKLRDPKPAAHLVLGTELHQHIENWLREGTPPPSKLAKAALEWLPARGSGMMGIEKSLEDPLLMTEGIPWKGFIDLLYQPHGATNVVKVFDHKTTTNMSWAKSSNDLQEDLQMMTYAKWAIDADDAIEKVELQHTYMVTSTSDKTDAAETFVTRKQIEDFWPTLDNKAKEMKGIAAALAGVPNAWEQAQPNWDSCGAFGGCAFRGVLCKRNKSGNVFEGISEINQTGMENKKMSLQDIVAAKKAAALANGAVVLSKAVEVKPKSVSPTPKPAVTVLPPDAPVQNKETTAAKMAAEVKKVEEATAAKAEVKAEAKAGKKLTIKEGVSPEVTNIKQIVEPLQNAVVSVQAIKESFILCLYCLPMTSIQSVPLEIVIANLTEAISKQHNTLWVAMDYAKKTSTLTEALSKYTFEAKCYTFNTSDALQESVITSVLVKRALHVFRGSK